MTIDEWTWNNIKENGNTKFLLLKKYIKKICSAYFLSEEIQTEIIKNIIEDKSLSKNNNFESELNVNDTNLLFTVNEAIRIYSYIKDTLPNCYLKNFIDKLTKKKADTELTMLKNIINQNYDDPLHIINQIELWAKNDQLIKENYQENTKIFMLQSKLIETNFLPKPTVINLLNNLLKKVTNINITNTKDTIFDKSEALFIKIALLKKFIDAIDDHLSNNQGKIEENFEQKLLDTKKNLNNKIKKYEHEIKQNQYSELDEFLTVAYGTKRKSDKQIMEIVHT